jgi:hypothetical protein
MGTALIDCGQGARDLLARLATPSRNRYYYGKLLDAYHFELEQRYGNNKRWLLNRLSLGAGVLCGLEVTASADGSRVRIGAGVAIDGVGREIIVPQDSPPIDPRQPTDDCGRPDGPPIRGDEAVTLYICYHECEAEPAPALVSECGADRGCENGLVRERYRLRIGRGEPAPPGLISDEQCARIFGAPPANTTRRTVVCETLGGACATPDEDCIPLAVIRFTANRGVTIEQCAFRRTLYSNAVLLDLILCLAARVDRCCGAQAVKSLVIVSGNNQAGTVGQPLREPLVTRVLDGGTPVASQKVTFDVVPGGGKIGDTPGTLGGSFSIDTDTAGIATLPIWVLGPNPGAQRVTARIDPGAVPSLVTFIAKAEPAVVDLPVVRVIWPTNAVTLDPRSPDPVVRDWIRQWFQSPRIEVTFSHKMNAAQLGAPDPWLRVFMLLSLGQNEIQVRRLNVAHHGAPAQPILTDAGFAELFALRGFEPNMLLAGPRFLVQMRAQSGSIVDTNAPPQLLDAEFRGTKLTPVQLDQIWKVTAPQMVPQAIWDAFVDTGEHLPHSGEGNEGGLFQSWFEIVRIDTPAPGNIAGNPNG